MHYWRAAKAGRSAKIIPIRGDTIMATERKFAKKLPLTMAFTVLLVAAFGAGCKGFFQSPTISTIAIQPPSPQVQVGLTFTLQAWAIFGAMMWTRSSHSRMFRRTIQRFFWRTIPTQKMCLPIARGI